MDVGYEFYVLACVSAETDSHINTRMTVDQYLKAEDAKVRAGEELHYLQERHSWF
jgi:hypothetical protein